jgi:hypothetical protein
MTKFLTLFQPFRLRKLHYVLHPEHLSELVNFTPETATYDQKGHFLPGRTPHRIV